MYLDEFYQNGIAKLDGILIQYSTNRKIFDRNFVGQFLDDEGIKDKQFGIYGMAMFLTITAQSYDNRVIKLRNECIEKFKFWINQTLNYDISHYQSDANDRSDETKTYVYELSNVVSKMCFAYEACHENSELSAEAQILKKHLESARSSNGSFAYLCSDKGSRTSVITTALALRTYLIFHTNDENIIQTLKFLKEEALKLKNIFEILYVYNSIQIILNQNTLLAKNGFSNFHENITKSLKKVFSEVSLNPTSFANPINVDFNDYGRTRYYRLYSDLILIEALGLAHPNHLHYLGGSVGNRILKKVWDCLTEFTQKDTTSHRLSFGFTHDIYQILKVTRSKYVNKLSFFEKIQRNYANVNLFGIDPNKELYILKWLLPLLGLYGVIFYYLLTVREWPIPAYINTIFSVLIARFANFFGLKYDIKQKNNI